MKSSSRPLTFAELEAQARLLVQSLGIAMYIRDGMIWQHGPGERIDPPPYKEPLAHGWNTRAAKETDPK